MKIRGDNFSGTLEFFWRNFGTVRDIETGVRFLESGGGGAVGVKF